MREALVFRGHGVQDDRNPSQCGDREGNMDELIHRRVARTGTGQAIAEQSTDVIHSLPPIVSEFGGATHGATRGTGLIT
jgi:hypothetical protein